MERRENMCTMRERAEDRRLTEDSIVFLRLKQNISLRNVSSFVITFDFTDFPVVRNDDDDCCVTHGA